MDEQALREGWAKKAADHVVGCGTRSRQHRATWGVWATVTAVLTVLGVGGAALASASLLSDAEEGSTLRLVGGWLGVVAAIASALNVWTVSQTNAHKKGRDGFAALRSRFADFAILTSRAEAFEKVRSDWENLTAQREQVQADSPEPPRWPSGLVDWFDRRRDRARP
ncbi:hypothetical protein AB0K14_11395 [Actinosynnema sp. NPDC050801]|uniref:hypothetical protein n=1 Tax=unclassified Actinosynnema TaxID=2637065 RepID=UPI0033EE96C1